MNSHKKLDEIILETFIDNYSKIVNELDDTNRFIEHIVGSFIFEQTCLLFPMPYEHVVVKAFDIGLVSENLQGDVFYDAYSGFLRQVRDKLKDKIDPNELKIGRAVSPPIEAYEYIGHSNLKVNPRNESYAALFD